MAQFGYQVLGFGSFTSAGGPGVWALLGDTISSRRYMSVIAGNASAALIFGGANPATDVVETWNGASGSFTTLSETLIAASASSNGGGTQSSALSISGTRGGSRSTACEKWSGSSFTAADSLTTATQDGCSAVEDKDNAWSCGGYTGSASGKHEIMRSGTWTAQSTDLLTPRYYLANNACGSSGNGAAVTGSTGSRSTKNEEYTYSSGSSGSWTTNADITTALDENPGCFGKTSADDLVVFSVETNSVQNGGTYEYSANTWTTGNNVPTNIRNNFGGGPTGNGLTVGGFIEGGPGYQDEAYSFTRAIST